MTLRVGLTYNLKGQPKFDKSLPEDFDAEFDDQSTVDAIAEALGKGGCKVTGIEANEEAYDKLKRENPDIVFNMSEGLRGESRESHIPAMLEMLGIPYTGSGPLTLAVALNKALTHHVLRSNGVPSPSFQVFEKSDQKLGEGLSFPLVIKPLAEGSSKGVRSSSLVKDEKALRKQLRWVINNYKQPAIAEEFLSGREFTVGIIGNDEPKVLPPVEIQLNKLPKGAGPLYSYEAKWIWDTPEKPLEMFSCPAELPNDMEKEIRAIAALTFKALGCRDICRIDMRLDDKEQPRVIEVNPLPGLIPDPEAHSCLPEAARAAGFNYDQLICTILWYALSRYDMQERFEKKSLVKIL